MLSTIAQRKYEALGLFSLFTGLLGGYFYFKTKNSPPPHSPPQNNHSSIFHHGELTLESKCNSEIHSPAEKWSSLYSEFYFDKNLQIRKVLDLLDSQGIQVEPIYKYSPLIAIDEYRKFTSEIKRRRRLIRTFNEDQYIRLILDYEQQIDELLERSREEIIYECQIDPDEFSRMKVIYEATEDLSSLMREGKKALKNMSFCTKRSIPKSTLVKIINEEICLIKNKLYERLKRKLEEDQVLRVIQALMEDIIYEKFGYEREEIEHSISFQWQRDILKEVKELTKCRSDLQSEIGNISLMSQQSDAESEKDIHRSSQGLTRSGANSSAPEGQDY